MAIPGLSPGLSAELLPPTPARRVMRSAKNEELEGALWTALRTLEERAALHRGLADEAARRENPRVAKHFRASAEDMRRQAVTIRSLLLEREPPPRTGTEG